jgi:enoyl-CoA hydratase/carnithine racemase
MFYFVLVARWSFSLCVGDDMESFLEYKQENGVVFLTLNGPETRNALSGEELFSGFEQAVLKINGDLSVGAVILTGAGNTFCSGGNVLEMREKKGMFGGTAQQISNQYRGGIQRIPRALYQMDAPLIGAINGPAIGAGCDLACVCDIRIASEKASFAESYVKLGIVPGFGGTWLLPRAVGYSRAAELAFTGDPLDATAALATGIVSSVVPAGDLLKVATALAHRICKNPSQAVRWTKRLMREAQNASFDTILELAATYQGLAHHTSDHAEAMAAMLDKREAKFSGS